MTDSAPLSTWAVPGNLPGHTAAHPWPLASVPMRGGVYIDGFTLYSGGRGLCGKGTAGWRWLDLRGLAARLVAKHSTWAGATIERVVYCTAAISGADNPVGNKEQDAYLRALKRASSADHIEMGNYVRRVARAPLAGAVLQIRRHLFVNADVRPRG